MPQSTLFITPPPPSTVPQAGAALERGAPSRAEGAEAEEDDPLLALPGKASHDESSWLGASWPGGHDLGLPDLGEGVPSIGFRVLGSTLAPQTRVGVGSGGRVGADPTLQVG